MTSVKDIAEEIVAREGGFVNDKDDPGGATNHGVTIGTLRRLGIDVNRDARIDVADVRALSRPQAVDIYLEHYFKRPGLAALPEALQASVFDMYVNSGANAVKILQRLLTQMGYPCEPDGAIGPRRPSARRRWPGRRRRRIWPMPTGLPGATITTRWPMRAPPAASSRAGRTAARAAGLCGPRPSSRRSTT